MPKRVRFFLSGGAGGGSIFSGRELYPKILNHAEDGKASRMQASTRIYAWHSTV